MRTRSHILEFTGCDNFCRSQTQVMQGPVLPSTKLDSSGSGTQSQNGPVLVGSARASILDCSCTRATPVLHPDHMEGFAWALTEFRTAPVVRNGCIHAGEFTMGSPPPLWKKQAEAQTPCYYRDAVSPSANSRLL